MLWSTSIDAYFKTRTKALARYQTPIVASLLQKMALSREKLSIACDEAWNQFLGFAFPIRPWFAWIADTSLNSREFKDRYSSFHEVMRKLATLDCLNSLALLAKLKPGYVRPIISDSSHVTLPPLTYLHSSLHFPLEGWHTPSSLETNLKVGDKGRAAPCSGGVNVRHLCSQLDRYACRSSAMHDSDRP